MPNRLSARPDGDDDALNDLNLTDDQINEMIGGEEDDEEGDPLYTDDGDDADEGEDEEPDSDEDDEADDESDGDEQTPADDASRDDPATSDPAPAKGEAADADGTDADRPASDDAPGRAPAQVAPEPFHFNADGTRVDVPDSAVVDLKGQKTVVISLESWQRNVQPHLRHQSVWQKREQEFRERDPERHPDVVAARTMVAKLKDLLADETGEKLQAFADDLERNRDLLERDVKIAQLEASTNARQSDADRERQSQEYVALEQQMSSALEGTLTQMAKDEFKGMDAKAAQAALWSVRNQIFAKADRDYPEYGVRKGETVILYDKIREILKPFHRPPEGGVVGAKKGQRAADDVAARNAKRLARGRRPAPVARAGSSAAPGRKERQPKTREEWEKANMDYLNSIVNDAD